MKILSLFSGIGAFEKALDNLGIDYELVAYFEIDKYASKSYAAIHGVSEDLNLWDVTKVDTSVLPKDIDLCTYGFPCQDISNAGKMRGFTDEDGNRTRSGLFFEALRIIEDTQPRIAIAENVKNLTGKKFKNEFEIVLNSLEEAGYNNYWKVLNAKDFGVPQNRERVFIVSIRKDVDNGRFEFPKAFPLERRLKDMLEAEVDESFYLSEDKIKSIANWKSQQKPLEHVNGQNSIVQCLTARGAGLDHSGMVTYSDSLENTTNIQLGIDKSNNNPKIIDVANCITAREDRGVSNHRGEGTAIIELEPDTAKTICLNSKGGRNGVEGLQPSLQDRVYSSEDIAPACVTSSGFMPSIAEPVICASRGRNPDNPSDRTPGAPTEQRIEVNTSGCSNTITTVQKDNYVLEPEKPVRVKVVRRKR